MRKIVDGLLCPHCNATFTGNEGRKFCSIECKNAAQRAPPVACDQCGVSFQKRKRVQRFCSLPCSTTHIGNHLRKWDDRCRSRVAKLWAEGIPTREIGRLLGGKSKNVIISLAHRMGLQPRPSVIRPLYGPPRPPAAPKLEPEVIRMLSVLPFIPPVVAPHKACQFIEGEARSHAYCGCAAKRGYSWCQKHYEIVFTAESRAA